MVVSIELLLHTRASCLLRRLRLRIGLWQRSPDGLRKMRIILPARNHVPMQMGHDIAERCQVDLIGLELLPLRLFNEQHDPQQLGLLGCGEVCHLNDVRSPDYTRKPRIQRITSVNDT